STRPASPTCSSSPPAAAACCRPASCTPTWSTGWPGRRPSRPATSWACASAPWTTARRWTSPSASPCGRCRCWRRLHADAAAQPGELSQAFEPRFRRTPEEAARWPLLRRYADADGRWRRIDDDWLNTAEQLALHLDSDTNNTSLALAFELSPGGGVLLFPGDAQVGNWLSWEKCSWPGAGGAAVTAADLLRRTVLYKGGHHPSHNATLRAGGLELMDSPDLVALVPVDREMALRKGWAGMPFPPLLSRLQERARGRVLRGDAPVPAKPDGVSQGVW